MNPPLLQAARNSPESLVVPPAETWCTHFCVRHENKALLSLSSVKLQQSISYSFFGFYKSQIVITKMQIAVIYAQFV